MIYSLANLITISRLLLTLLVVTLMLQPPSLVHLFLLIPLTIFIFVSDGLDGWAARRFNQTSQLGAVLDIAVDRTVELCFWVAFAYMKLIPLWIPLLFIVRGVMVDAIRSETGTSSGQAPFDLMRTRLGKFLVAGRFVRGFYAVIKAFAFCFLILAYAIPVVFGELAWISPQYQPISLQIIWAITWISIGLAVALCVIRGLPVLIEFVYQQGPPAADSLASVASGRQQSNSNRQPQADQVRQPTP